MSHPGDRTWTADSDAAGVRLDKYLAADGRLQSRGRAAEALARGKVFVNGEEAGPDAAARRLARGDVVRVWMDRPGSRTRRATPVAQAPDVRIVHEDAALIVVDKPAGLLTVPLERRFEADSVLDFLEGHLRHKGKRKPLVVHRIDRDTSGLVVFAKTGSAQHRLKEQFRRREPGRVYVALVYGVPSPPQGTWRDTLVWDRQALIQKETHPNDPRGKEAIADYRLVEAFDGASLLEVRLQTGKRNQIRLQARLRGHTLVGEERYVFGPDALRPLPFPRQALHAARLEFLHPVDGRQLQFESPMPQDMAALVRQLRAGRRSL